MDRVADDERGGAGGPSSSSSPCPVYNLSVDQAHTYVAAGIVVHNCHHALAPTFVAIRSALRCRHLGVTATPFRAAGRGETAGLGDVYEAVVFEYSIHDAIAAGDLVPIRARRLLLDVDLSGVDLADYDDIASRYDIAEINNAIAADYHAHHAGVPTVVFTANIAHAKHLALALGPRAAAVWGEDRDRSQKLAAFHAGNLDILCNRDVLTEGWDAPRATVAYLACPLSSVVGYVQRIGRITRTYPGKSEGLVVDCCGSSETVPYVTWADLGKAEKDAAKRAKENQHREAKARAQTFGAEVVGQQSYEVFIFGQAAARRLGVGWHEWQRTYVASAHRWGSDLRAAVVLERDGTDWQAIGITRDQPRVKVEWEKGQKRQMIDDHDAFSILGRGSLDHCGDLARDYFDRLGLHPTAPDAAWKATPATEPQLRALKAFGVRRDGISRGEASATLDATTARRKVQEARREGRI